MADGEITSIRCHTSLKEQLNKIKIHHRETHEEVIERLIEERGKHGKE